MNARRGGLRADADARLVIVHLVARSHRRGAELVALELGAELEALGHVNRVVALGAGDDGGHEDGLPPLIDATRMGPRELVTGARRLHRLLRDTPADVVIAHGGWAAEVAAFARLRPRTLLVWQRIGSLSPSVWSPPRRWWWRTVARRFDVGVALTADLAAELSRLGFRGPIWRIPNSRNPERFARLDRRGAAAQLRAEVGVDADVHLYAFVGHLDAAKRADRALAAHAAVLARGVRAHLVVVGAGPLRSDLEAQVAHAGVADRVTFLGRRTDVERILGGAELLLVTSDVEGVPGVAIEAAMAGCPVVSVPVGGVAEVVEDGVTGRVLANADVEHLADAVASLLADPARREAMGRAGRARTEEFSSATTARVYADSLLAEVASR